MNRLILQSGIIVSDSIPYFYRDYCLLFTTNQSGFGAQICDDGMYVEENTRFPTEYGTYFDMFNAVQLIDTWHFAN